MQTGLRFGHCQKSSSEIAEALVRTMYMFDYPEMAGKPFYPGGLYIDDKSLSILRMAALRGACNGDSNANSDLKVKGYESRGCASVRDKLNAVRHPGSVNWHLFADRLFCSSCKENPCPLHQIENYQNPFRPPRDEQGRFVSYIPIQVNKSEKFS